MVEAEWLSLLGLRDLSEGKDGDVGEVFTNVVVFAAGVIRSEGGDISFNWSDVGGDVLGEGLKKLDWVGELLTPDFELGNITLDLLAVVKVGWDLLDNLTNFLGGLDDALKASLLEISDDSGEFNLKGLAVLQALLDFWEVILVDEAFHKTGDHLFGSLDVHFVGSAKIGGNSLDESHS